MKHAASIVILIGLMGADGAAAAQERANIAGDGPEVAKLLQRGDGVPLDKVITAVAKKSGKKFIVDGRVNGSVEILGQEVSAVSYSDLLSILLLNGYTAVDGGNYVTVIPVNGVRAEPLPLATARDNFPEAQFVTMVIPVKNAMAASLVPLLRPLLPTYGHLAAQPCANSLIVVDNFANVKRLEKLVASLDVGKPVVLPACDGESSHGTGSTTR